LIHEKLFEVEGLRSA
jgi:hypothetical protein